LAYVDPSLDMLIDIDISWENIQTAINNIISQVGGYMQVQFNPNNPAQRVLNLLPLPSGVAQPTDIGTTSPVLPQ